MFVLKVTEEQLKGLLLLLDSELKKGGLESLANVVDLHNMIASARKVEESVASEESKS